MQKNNIPCTYNDLLALQKDNFNTETNLKTVFGQILL